MKESGYRLLQNEGSSVLTAHQQQTDTDNKIRDTEKHQQFWRIHLTGVRLRRTGGTRAKVMMKEGRR